MQQASLLCGCGASVFSCRGFCRTCQRRARLNRQKFEGEREAVLQRDRVCQGCGESRRLLVHHRQPGRPRSKKITLCRRCHPRVHHTFRPRFGFSPILRQLWREIHPGVPEQRPLFVEPKAADAEQLALPGAAELAAAVRAERRPLV